MRQKLVVANWKMNLSCVEAKRLAGSCVELIPPKLDVEVVISPPFTLLFSIQEVLRKSLIKLGAQDVFWLQAGAYTGNISASMLLDAGVDYCIVGHSEKRGRFGNSDFSPHLLSYFSESNETINLKIKALFGEFISPILCVGETLEEKSAGKTDTVIKDQLEGALRDQEISQLHQLVVAYEPVWAIGTGQTCDAKEAEHVCSYIRDSIAELTDPDVASFVRILYGGSVKASNAKEIFSQKNIDGGLVGGASLDAHEFSRICKEAASQ